MTHRFTSRRIKPALSRLSVRIHHRALNSLLALVLAAAALPGSASPGAASPTGIETPIITRPMTTPSPTPQDLVAALQGTFGRHAGARASHAKGFCATGEFFPSFTAQHLTSAALYQEKRLAATIRFSIGGGNPRISDKARAVRGLAIRLQGERERHELVLISEPIFFAATPTSFVEFLKARIPDPATGKPDPDKVKAYAKAFPDGTRQPALVASHAPTASYATTSYHSTHAFAFNAEGARTWARLVAAPVAGLAFLSPDDEATGPDAFLEAEAIARLERAPVEFIVYAQPAAPGDSIVDPTQSWTQDGPAPIELGLLKVRARAEATACDVGTFIPTVLPAGIEPSDDPILLARAASYGVSLNQRRR